MKNIISKTILLGGLLTLSLFMIGATDANAQASATRSGVSATVRGNGVSDSARQRLIAQLATDIRQINMANLPAVDRQFALSALLQNFIQSLQGYEESGSTGSSSEYDRAVDAVDDYLMDRENEDDFSIDRVIEYRNYYVVEVELDNGDDKEVRVDSRYRVTDYGNRVDRDDVEEDNINSKTLDDTTRAFDDEIEFRLKFDIEAGRDDLYVPRDIREALQFVIVDRDGREYADQDDFRRNQLEGELRSTASATNDYFLFEEGDEEELEVVITFTPQSSSTSTRYRLELIELGYNDQPRQPNDELRFRSGDYVSGYYSLR